jgi:hypothetical protein
VVRSNELGKPVGKRLETKGYEGGEASAETEVSGKRSLNEGIAWTKGSEFSLLLVGRTVVRAVGSGELGTTTDCRRGFVWIISLLPSREGGGSGVEVASGL